MNYPNCRLCHEPLTENERDYESGSFSDAHMGCKMESQTETPFWYYTVQSATNPIRTSIHFYTTAQRASEMAEACRRANLRAYPCGEHLDIVYGYDGEQVDVELPELERQERDRQALVARRQAVVKQYPESEGAKIAQGLLDREPLAEPCNRTATPHEAHGYCPGWAGR